MTVLAERHTDNSPATTRSRFSLVLVAIIGAAALVIALAAGYFWGDHAISSTAATPTSSSVDAGFARDMSTHHRQAITMAENEMSRGTSAQAKLFAFDIDSAQSVQLGEMQGWLGSWGLSPLSTKPMSWMGSGMTSMVGPNGLMPGMATPAQMTTLENSSGNRLDVLFLQLMIRHHQGGVHMAEYAAAHASQPYVQALAQKMVSLQSAEITQMTQTLKQLGGVPLPAPVG